MKTNKIAKITMILFLVGILATSLSVVFAGTVEVPGGGDLDPTTSSAVSNIVGSLITVIQIIAFGAAVIMLMFLGIKYISASPDGKAEIKKSATQYVVGAVILFAATGILQVVKSFARSNISLEGGGEEAAPFRLLLMK